MNFLAFLKNQKVKRIGIGLLISFIILLLEVFVFNYRAFPNRGEKLLFANNDVEVNYATLVENDATSKPTYKFDYSTYPQFRITFAEEKDVRTVAPKIEFLNKDIYRYEMAVTGYYYRPNNTRVTIDPYRNIECVKGLNNSRYYETEFNHPIKEIQIAFKSVEHVDALQGLEFTFEGFEFNYKVPFYFSFFRFLLLNFLAIGTYLLVLLFIHGRKKIIEIVKQPTRYKVLDIIMYALPVLAVIIIYAFYGNFLRPVFLHDGGSQLSQELVDAFLKGHVHLDAVPSEQLLALPNPYDTSSRSGISYLWDHLLFNGKYYSYYGITPVFMLFLPFKALFKFYFADAYAVLLFTIVGLVFFALSYDALIKQIELKNKVPLYLKYTLFLIAAIGSGACFQVVRPYFYEASTSCAFMCSMVALFHFFKSGVFFKNPEKKHFYYHLVFSSLWMSLAVLARATFALYALAHLIYLGYYFVKEHKEMVTKQKVLFFVFALVPYVFFGSIQCIYNYLRFHSIFDFGIEYSLTIADFKHMPFHFGNVLTSIFHFLFNTGTAKEYAFFVNRNTLTFGGAFYYYESGATVGLFARLPMLFGIFVLPFFITSTKQERLRRLLLGWLPCVLLPFIQVALTWQSGYATRYYTDFTWPLLFFAIVIYLRFIDEKAQSDNAQKGTLVFMSASLLFALLYTSGTLLTYVPYITQTYGTPHYEFTNFYYRLARLLTFWR